MARRPPLDPDAEATAAEATAATAAYIDTLLIDRRHPHWPLMIDLIVPPPVELAPGEVAEPTATRRGGRKAK
jgi:hypothetical protein